MRILVTGGAGFIGSHLVDALVRDCHDVVVLDRLDPQVHLYKSIEEFPYKNSSACYVVGDVGDYSTIRGLIGNVDAVYHLAASVGVGQSMYKIYQYVKNNSCGAANLLQAIHDSGRRLKKLIVASSMSIYGEGLYACSYCGLDNVDIERKQEDLHAGKLELHCPNCKKILRSIPTPEKKSLKPSSIYAVTKRDHEELFTSFGKAYGIPTTALRFFGVYGPRQSLSNPYTGVAAVFASRLLNNAPPLIFEDGFQLRDFVHVSDIVQGLVLAIKDDYKGCRIFNVGSGKATSVLHLARVIQEKLQKARILEAKVQQDVYDAYSPEPKILGGYRAGDIRSCYADISSMSKELGYQPKIMIEDGVSDLIGWVKNQNAHDDVNNAMGELLSRSLITINN